MTDPEMIFFEESAEVTPEMWDAVRRYDKSGGWPAQLMSKRETIRRRNEGKELHDYWWGMRLAKEMRND